MLGTTEDGFSFSNIGSTDFEGDFKYEDTLICPGGTAESCIQVCPGNTPLLYFGCVQGCVNRCDGQNGQGGQAGQDGHAGLQLGQTGPTGQTGLVSKGRQSDQF